MQQEGCERGHSTTVTRGLHENKTCQEIDTWLDTLATQWGIPLWTAFHSVCCHGDFFYMLNWSGSAGLNFWGWRNGGMCAFQVKWRRCWTDPLDIFKDQVEFPSPAKSFLQLHNVVLLQGPEHLQLPKRRLLDLLIFCERGWDDTIIPPPFPAPPLPFSPLFPHSPSLSLNFLMATSSLVSCKDTRMHHGCKVRGEKRKMKSEPKAHWEHKKSVVCRSCRKNRQNNARLSVYLCTVLACKRPTASLAQFMRNPPAFSWSHWKHEVVCCDSD